MPICTYNVCANLGIRRKGSAHQKSGPHSRTAFHTRNTGGTLLCPPAKNKTSVSAAKAERIRYGVLRFELARRVRHEIEIAAFAGTLKVHSGGHDPFAQCQHCN